MFVGNICSFIITDINLFQGKSNGGIIENCKSTGNTIDIEHEEISNVGGIVGAIQGTSLRDLVSNSLNLKIKGNKIASIGKKKKKLLVF